MSYHLQLLKVILPLIIFLNLSLAAMGQVQQLSYAVRKGDSRIGTLNVTVGDSAGSRLYSSSLEARLCMLLFTIQVKDTRKARFKGRVLQYARAERRVQGRPSSSSETCLKGCGYTDGSKKIESLDHTLDYTTLNLFMQEPVDKRTVYSEYYQKEYPIETLEPHHYRIRMADGNTGEYFYKAGICYKIVTQTRWATVTSLLQQDQVATQ